MGKSKFTTPLFLKSLALMAITQKILFSPDAWATLSSPTSFTLEGMLYSSPSGTDPLLDASVSLRVQILNPAKDCVLYDEGQNIDTSASEGLFHVQVGSQLGDPVRTSGADPGNSMTAIFQNSSTILGSDDNGNACAYHPAAGDARYLRLIVTPSSTGVADILSPDMQIGSVPSALVAETLGGLSRTDVLALGAGQLTQSNVENVFSSTNYPALEALLNGSSSTYARSSSNGVGIPSVSAAPASQPAGTIWYNSASNTLQFSDGTATPQTVGTSSGLTSISVNAPLSSSGGSTPTLSLGTVGVANGGTGVTTLTGLVKGNGTSAFAAATPGTDYLTSSGSTTDGHLAMWNGSGQLIDGGALQWTNGASSSISYSSGNVGIGTTAPAAQLDIFAGATGGSLLKFHRNDGLLIG